MNSASARRPPAISAREALLEGCYAAHRMSTASPSHDGGGSIAEEDARWRRTVANATRRMFWSTLLGALPVIGLVGASLAAFFVWAFTKKRPGSPSVQGTLLSHSLRALTIVWPGIHLQALWGPHSMSSSIVSGLLRSLWGTAVPVLALFYLRELFLSVHNVLATRRAAHLAVWLVALSTAMKIFSWPYPLDGLLPHPPPLASFFLPSALLGAEIVVATLSFVLVREFSEQVGHSGI
jgi:hypothetical protein